MPTPSTSPASTGSEDLISSKQREFVSKLLDDREKTVESLDELLMAVKGKQLDQLNRTEASALITLLIGRERQRRR
jgi:hypothetical protein